jgi:hypothetical protein
MGLPFETPGGYDEDDGTAADTGRNTDDLTTPDYDGYSHDPSGGQQDPAGEDDLFEDGYDFEGDFYDGRGQGDRADWDPDTGPMGGPEQI